MTAAEKIGFPPLRMTEEEYLNWEAEQPEKWEYFNGEVMPVHGYIYKRGEIIDMAGALPKHNLIVQNLSVAVGVALRGKPCRAYSSDLKVKSKKSYMFPDLTIVCEKLELAPGTRDIVINPKVVFEVLSDATENKDRTIKLEAYSALESVQEYVLVSQHEPVIQHYLRQSDGGWTVHLFEAGQNFLLHSCGVTLSVDEIYEGAFDETFTGSS